jgi:hypothetical protein
MAGQGVLPAFSQTSIHHRQRLQGSWVGGGTPFDPSKFYEGPHVALFPKAADILIPVGHQHRRGPCGVLARAAVYVEEGQAATKKQQRVGSGPDVIMKCLGFGPGEDEGDAVTVPCKPGHPRAHFGTIRWIEPHPACPRPEQTIIVDGEVPLGCAPRTIDRGTGIEIERTKCSHKFRRGEPLLFPRHTPVVGKTLFWPWATRKIRKHTHTANPSSGNPVTRGFVLA